MTSYENARWEEIQAWRSTTQKGLAERLPENLRDRAKQVAQKAGELWDKVPGNDALEKAFASAIKGGFDMALDITGRRSRSARWSSGSPRVCRSKQQATTTFAALI